MMDILDRSPWSFDKRLVLSKRLEGDLSLGNVKFQQSPFWIRVFNIPNKSMNTTVGNHIAKEIGTPLLIDAPRSGLAWGPFLRMRMDIDISKPLMRGKMVHIEDMEDGWFHFKYERLPIFCYRCRILGHQERECPSTRRGCISADEDDLQYGPWLRVVGPKAVKSKTSFSQPNTDEASDEENLETEGNDGDRDQSTSYLQVLNLPSVRTANPQAAMGLGSWLEKSKPKRIYDSQGNVIGIDRMLSFKAKDLHSAKLNKTNWIMHEFSLANQEFGRINTVLCVIYKLNKGSGSDCEEANGRDNLYI
uniref:CCHC-type domain-containing protein n=1 Tax=Quercus lobata TaxID=97700 RepID=A0A7N2R350_QUELO